jgi:putative nucleotidyltransferase with HDIG domain
MSAGETFDIDSLLEEVVTLPSMPTSVARITELLDQPGCAMSEVAKVISSDPSIALKTLRLVNSAYYGLNHNIASVEHAVVLLGAKVIKNLTLTATVFDAMQGRADQFLRHSVGCGVAMRTLARHVPRAQEAGSPDEAFVFGLLHDIGKVILEEYLPGKYEETASAAHTRTEPWYRVEQEIVGVDHAELGGQLARHWKLDAQVAEAIAGHHELERCAEEYRVFAASLCLADYISSLSGLPCQQDMHFLIPEAVWEYTGLTSKTLPPVLQAWFHSYHETQELIDMVS